MGERGVCLLPVLASKRGKAARSDLQTSGGHAERTELSHASIALHNPPAPPVQPAAAEAAALGGPVHCTSSAGLAPDRAAGFQTASRCGQPRGRNRPSARSGPAEPCRAGLWSTGPRRPGHGGLLWQACAGCALKQASQEGCCREAWRGSASRHPLRCRLLPYPSSWRAGTWACSPTPALARCNALPPSLC